MSEDDIKQNEAVEENQPQEEPAEETVAEAPKKKNRLSQLKTSLLKAKSLRQKKSAKPSRKKRCFYPETPCSLQVSTSAPG